MKTILAIHLTLIVVLACNAGNGKKEYIGIEEESKMKEYNPNATWQTVPCSKCNGTGSKIVYFYDVKANRTIKYLEPCPWCKGSGTVGMSKK